MQDGDGLEIRSVKTDYSQETHAPLSTTIYYKIRSIVLQGKTIAETSSYVQGHVDGSGYVYAGGELLATKQGSSVSWEHVDPGSTTKQHRSLGSWNGWRTEMDPMGSDVGLTYTVVLPPPPPEPTKWLQSGGFGQPDPEDPVILSNGRQVHCYVDGNLTGCANAFNQLRLGLAVVDEPHTDMSALTGLGRWQYVKGGARDPSRSGDVPGPDGVLRTAITEKGHWEFTPEEDSDPENTGAGGGSGPSLNTGPRAHFDSKRFNKCLQDFFGIVADKDGSVLNPFFDRRYGGSFKGFANGDPAHTYTVITKIDRNSATLAQDLNRANQTPNDWLTQSGLTLKDDFKGRFGVNYVASDVAANPKNLDIGLLGLYIHELGNGLGVETGIPNPFGAYAAENAKFGIDDEDVGAAFERCAFGGLVGLRSGRVGSHREFP